MKIKKLAITALCCAITIVQYCSIQSIYANEAVLSLEKETTDKIVIDSKTGITYELHNGKYVVAEYKGTIKKVEIKSNINGITVNEIKENVFENNKLLEEVHIPATILTIDDSAFYGCSNLKTVIIENGVSYIGECAFADCRAMKQIRIPTSVNVIEKYAFYKCDSNLLIMGVKDSEAHRYAKRNGLNFNVRKPDKVYGLKVTKKNGKAIKLSWGKSKNAKKWEIYKSDRKKGKYKKIKTVTTNYYVDKDRSGNRIIHGKRYYYKVRAVASNSNVYSYGDFSNAKSIIVKPDPVKISIKHNSGKVEIRWSSSKRNGKYVDVYIKENENKFYRLNNKKIPIKGKKASSFTWGPNDNQLHPGNIYSFKIVTYSYFGKRKVESVYSNVVKTSE